VIPAEFPYQLLPSVPFAKGGEWVDQFTEIADERFV
jgi:hypothetical protein